ncbi:MULTISPECIES: GNAT family N-acetyltransferase [Actinoplanes]|uniref:GNAT family N-acetyltransferase n=1 Tax=Actinoplanes TaxID=1865 RepID=UPI0005F28303|nr:MULTISPECIES: GNAT family N-acetyltransferase [Actinoplanes]GLY02330.1 hypothetical protein Acsp01_27090 [Actinoplanes sp. NBRC 101535]
MTTITDFTVLDDPVGSSLRGPHAALADTAGSAVRYPDDIAPFGALDDTGDPAAWAGLAALTTPGTETLLLDRLTAPPAGWTRTGTLHGIQYTGAGMRTEPDPEAVPLGPADVPDILDLVARTRPGPFRDRTIALGSYLGIRRDGRLVAMAGERFRPPGYTEISAVCTDPAVRGQGLAARLVRAVAHGIRSRGEIPFLHVIDGNTAAIRLYESMGFDVRTHVRFVALRSPRVAPRS